MRFDLKKPCKNCPFSKADTRIKFSCRERAEEIENTAYRRGFPCHLSAKLIESDDFDEGGFVFGRNTQHCAGSLAMHINDGYSSTPGTGNNEDLFNRLTERLDLDAAFESVEDFIEANERE